MAASFWLYSFLKGSLGLVCGYETCPMTGLMPYSTTYMCTHRNGDETVGSKYYKQPAEPVCKPFWSPSPSHLEHLHWSNTHPITTKVTDSLPTVTTFIAHYLYSLSLDLFVCKNWPAQYTNLRPYSRFVLCSQIFMLYEKIRICCFIFVLMSTIQSTPTLTLRLCVFNFCPWSLENEKNKSLARRNKPTIWYYICVYCHYCIQYGKYLVPIQYLCVVSFVWVS